MEPTINRDLIPLDKSWIIRMGILDIVHGHKDIQSFLESQENLGDDLVALKRASELWTGNKPIDVGESGTLYRFLLFASWKLGLKKQFITRGTLRDRHVANDPTIVNLSLHELLKLDKGTSQWASAAVLLGNEEKIPNPPYKLQVTYAAVEQWNEKRKAGKVWGPRYDQTIERQAEVFLKLLAGQHPAFIPEQAEDYCFARTFGYITQEEGDRRWPALRNHESDRIAEMDAVLDAAIKGKAIDSRDHRVVQAISLWGIINHIPLKITHPESVSKTWPQFWAFLDSVK